TTDSPAILTVAARSSPAFAAARSVVVALADPLDGPAIVSHGESLAAVHAHPFSVVMVTDTVPPSAGTVAFGGATLKRQAAASCVTGTWTLLTANVARR